MTSIGALAAGSWAGKRACLRLPLAGCGPAQHRRCARTSAKANDAVQVAHSGPCRSYKLFTELPRSAIDPETGKAKAALEPFIAQEKRPRRKRSKKATEASEGQIESDQEAAAPSPVRVGDETNGTPSEDSSGSTAESPSVPRLLELGPQGQAWPNLAKDVLTNLARFPGCILLTRVGGFYEVSKSKLRRSSLEWS